MENLKQNNQENNVRSSDTTMQSKQANLLTENLKKFIQFINYFSKSIQSILLIVLKKESDFEPKWRMSRNKSFK